MIDALLPSLRRLAVGTLVILMTGDGATRVLGRTIELSDTDCPLMAMIGPQAPRSGWMMTELAVGEFSTAALDLRADRSFLICYPIHRIPEGQRIARAEWVFPVQASVPAGGQRLIIRRILVPWGIGVCHLYRMQRPRQVPWTVPGAEGLSTDRAAQAIVSTVTETGEHTVNVTEDVELWNAGAAENYGWIVTIEDPAALIRVGSPFWASRGTLKLRVTYEPE